MNIKPQQSWKGKYAVYHNGETLLVKHKRVINYVKIFFITMAEPLMQNENISGQTGELSVTHITDKN